MIYIRRTVQRISLDSGYKKTQIIIGEPKTTKSKRDIPIPNHMLPIFDEIKCSQKNVYFLSGTNKCYEPRRMQLIFHRYLNLAGLTPRGIHCTRHTFATRWVELGVDTKTLSEILGHSNIRTTLDKYVHISEKTKRENINKLVPYTHLDLLP